MNLIETRKLEWNLYSNMVAISVDGDGSCYFHAIAKAFFRPYQLGIMNGVGISRRDIVRNFRNELADRLMSRSIPEDPSSPLVYDTLSNGTLREFSNNVKEYSIENMIKELKSNSPVDYVYQELISNEINKDIYILSMVNKDVVKLGNPELYYKNRKSIVLLYSPGHYELVGIINENNDIRTIFEPSDPFIVRLKERVL
jgi:hypothetical protein